MAPAALLPQSEASLSLLHHRVLQLALPDDRHIRLLAVDAHDDDIRVAGLTVISPHQGVLRASEFPAKLEEVGLRDDRRQRWRILLRQTPSCHCSHTPADLTGDFSLAQRLGETLQSQRLHDLLRDSGNLPLNIDTLGGDEAEMDASRRALARAGTHGPPFTRTSHRTNVRACRPVDLLSSRAQKSQSSSWVASAVPMT